MKAFWGKVIICLDQIYLLKRSFQVQCEEQNRLEKRIQETTKKAPIGGVQEDTTELVLGGLNDEGKIY